MTIKKSEIRNPSDASIVQALRSLILEGEELEEPLRRRLIVWAVWALQAVLLAPVAVVASLAVLRPALRRVEPRWVDVIPVGMVGPDPLLLPAQDKRAGQSRLRPVYLFKWNEEIVALSAFCTHLGCTVRWQEGARHFVCPCHGGRFSPDGTRTGGPPRRPLERLPVRVVEGKVQVRLA